MTAELIGKVDLWMALSALALLAVLGGLAYSLKPYIQVRPFRALWFGLTVFALAIALFSVTPSEMKTASMVLSSGLAALAVGLVIVSLQSAVDDPRIPRELRRLRTREQTVASFEEEMNRQRDRKIGEKHRELKQLNLDEKIEKAQDAVDVVKAKIKRMQGS